MGKTGPELRHDAKERMKKYRAEMIKKGYTSTTIFLSQEHRAELKRLGEEHRLTRAEAAEHILKIYLESENKDITQSNNTNITDQTKTLAIIKALEARVEALENQIEKIEDRKQNIETSLDIFETEDNDGIDLELEIELDDSEDMDNQTDESEAVIDGLILEPDDPEDKNLAQTHNKNTEQQTEEPVTPDIKPTDKPIQEIQTEIPAPIPDPKPKTESGADIQEQDKSIKSKPDQDMELPDYLVNVNPDMPIEERHKIILRIAEDFPGRAKGIPQKRIDLLNTAGILLNGKRWRKTKQFADQLSIARRWAKKIGYKP